MSGGMEDSRRLERAALDIETAAFNLNKALRNAGHRGWKVDELYHANEGLRGSGFKLVRYES